MAGRPTKKDRKSNAYGTIFPDGFLDKMDIIASREGISRKALLIRFCEEGFDKHAPGNPQTLMPTFSEGGEMTIQRMEGMIRQGLLRGKETSLRKILQALISEGVAPTERASMGKRIASWLKEKGIEVTY